MSSDPGPVHTDTHTHTLSQCSVSLYVIFIYFFIYFFCSIFFINILNPGYFSIKSNNILCFNDVLKIFNVIVYATTATKYTTIFLFYF